MAIDTPKTGRGSSKPKADAKSKDLPSTTTTSVADPEENFADDPQSEAYKGALKLYELVQQAYENKDQQADQVEEYWNIYSAEPDANQMYSGNSTGYVPAVRDALNARAKRALKQLFPVNNKHVEAVSTDGRTPYTELALLEHYIRTTRLASIVRSDLVAGDVTGQWGLMLDWTTSKRKVTKLVRRNPILGEIGGADVSDMDIEDPTRDEEDATEEETVVEQGPDIIDFATQDLAVVPPTCNDLQKAKAASIRLRLSRAKVDELVDQGTFVLPENFSLDDWFKNGPDKDRDRKPPEKQHAHDAGVKTKGSWKYALVYQVYTKLDLGGDALEEAIVYYAGPSLILGIIRNPLWSGRRPIISEPVDRIKGSFWGKSKVEPVKFLQWQLNDFWNMGQDSAMYSLLPIFTVDPLKCPNWSQLTMGLAAVFPVDPGGIDTLSVPALWKDSISMCEAIKRQIWESLEVTEMMMGRMPPGRKNAQMVGGLQQEQQISITDHASRYEQVMLNPLLEMLFEFDQQYRTEAIAVATMGEIGAKAKIEKVPVQQWGEHFFFRWSGTEYLNGLQRMQQQVAWTNVLKGIPPQMLGGLTLNLAPMLQSGTDNLFGPEMGPRILVDKRNQYAVEPEIENEILHNMMDVQVHEADDDIRHLQTHMKGAAVGDPMALFKNHMAMHMQQLQRKREMAMGPPPQQGLPGSPGGAGPGVAGTPRPGAQPAPGRPGQQPPGAINADQMADPAAGVRG